MELLHSNGATLKFLPTYSPELNPCEKVFGFVKDYIRNKRKEEPLIDIIAKAYKKITLTHMQNWYNHCKSCDIVQ
jgi:transposase